MSEELMEILQQTPNQLTLRLRPVLIWLVGGFFAAWGILPSVFAKATLFTCNRTEFSQSSCQLLTSGLLGSEVRAIPLRALQGAKVDKSIDSDGDTYRVIILTTSGEIPFTSYSGSGEDQKQEIASRINQFVRNPGETTLSVQQDDRFSAYLLGGIFSAIGLFLLVSSGQIVTCLSDKTLGTLTLKKQGLFSTKVTEHQIQEIADILVEESTDSDGCTYRVSILMKSGKRQALTNYYSSGKKSKQETADCLRRFLQLDHQVSS
jgi:hypothetical protein